MRLLQINTFSLIIYFQEDTKTEIYKTKSEPLALQPSQQATLPIPLFNLHIHVTLHLLFTLTLL